MAMPSWRDTSIGSMARAALWLVQEVGEGNIFTKAELRAAFPDVSQIDRRIRDLRDHNWKISPSREDATLRQQEQRFVSQGAEVWIPGKSKAPKHKASLTAAQRAKVLDEDGYLCRTCGIATGEAYEEGIAQAVLNVARRPVVQPGGEVVHQLITECKRCGAGGLGRQADLGQVLEQVNALSAMERRVLAAWIAADRRSLSPLDRLWGHYRTLPEVSRQAVADVLDGVDDEDRTEEE
ncbi:hypothetical protein OHB33_26045 [Streptomyces sp. NBC_01558]|uniref:hypothetical protein n=2 Tax=unclassified Streptomyces TaxID=2593676 RepID=UPI002DDB4C0B|nr:hypothetical protein [Streptomyces sp. NBC_01558]WSD79496.1 hypothetical protein OHB33_26045 [Streptomyces sp. NBC_01558]